MTNLIITLWFRNKFVFSFVQCVKDILMYAIIVDCLARLKNAAVPLPEMSAMFS